MNARIMLHKKRRKRIEAGHPWIFENEVQYIEGDIAPGDIVDVVNHQGLFLAVAYANPNSKIIARVLSYEQGQTIDTAFFAERINRAWQFRRRFLADAGSCRVIYGEADFLPGLIVDKFNDILVVQILAYGMEVLKPAILEALLEVFHPAGVYLRNDVPIRQLEGLELETGVWYGEVPEEVEIVENGLRFYVNIREGQKTGYFFDQRENRQSIAPLMRDWSASTLQNHDKFTDTETTAIHGAEVLDCFCHTGSFAIHALHYGAQHVTAVDVSELAISVAKRNAALNGYANGADFIVANAFDFLREAEQQQKTYDVVILDPPAFAKSKRALESAIRGYKEINLRGLKLVRDGGYLVTASCSYHMSPDLFYDTILSAAFDAHKLLRIIRWTGAAKDHPVIAGAPEGHYLKFAIYQVTSRK